MRHLAFVLVFLCSALAIAQNPSSDLYAVTLAQNSVAALTGGATINDVTLNANVTSILGSDYETGTGTFYSKGIGESRIDLSLSSSGNRSDVRNIVSGAPGGAWTKNGNPSTPYVNHNCWTDAGWFFPALSSLSQTVNPNFVFKYIGQEQHGVVNTQHIRVYKPGRFQSLSTMDFYLDAVSTLPVAIGLNVHPDDDMATNIATEIDFANYQSINGIKVPFHFQKIFNGSVILDSTVTNAVFNNGLPDSLFVLP